MAQDIDIELEGLDALQTKLLEVAGAVGGQKALARIGRKAFKPVLAAAIANAPKDTGVLAESIVMTTRRPKSGSVVASVGLRVVKTAAYKEGRKYVGKRGLKHLGGTARNALKRRSAHWRWHFVEKGTSKTRKQPFLRPALESNVQVVVQSIREGLEKELKRIARKQARGKGRK